MIISCLVSISSLGQQFTCPEIQQTVDNWNEFRDGFANDIDAWAKGVVANKMYRVNAKNQLEYDYIIWSKDTFDIALVRDLTIDYICEAYKVNNITRTTLVQGCTDRSVYFVGYYQMLSYGDVFLSRYYYDAEAIFNIKFKENRIRFTITVPYFDFHIGNYDVIRHEFFTLYPFTAPGRQDKIVLEIDERCLVNAIAKTITHPNHYLIYLNEHYVSNSKEDW